MYENKSLQLAILISMFLHFIVFLSAPYTGVLPKREPINPIKVSYFKIEKEPEKLVEQKIAGQKIVGQSKTRRALPSIPPEALPEVREEDIINPPFRPEPAVKQGQVKKEEPTVKTIGSTGRAVIGGKGKKFEAIINAEKDSGKKATYIGYYRLVREKIKYYADRNYIKEGSVSEGEVFLSFVVVSNGELIHIMVIDNKSADNTVLRKIAVDSVKDASPFPAFPQGMNQYQITFNVIISFELNK